MPITARFNSQRNGLRPPLVSTHAENGMRKSDPVSDGTATRNPRASGPSPITCWNRLAEGPNRATAAKPTKNPSVALQRAFLGERVTWSIFRTSETLSTLLPAGLEAPVRFDIRKLPVGIFGVDARNCGLAPRMRVIEADSESSRHLIIAA